ncbi:acyltransferase family protein [Paenibacillus sp. PL91]|uniref:acyltransferase family protein n=1 Tax=Paenibacillus sp. PL91 TaxID=2729538 RepID=UPI00145D89BA|nr:acyltransferase [Paenibacillus sp. PL91]MBC9199047.1 acyltransferase [Paenibacillus sp. PL91]
MAKSNYGGLDILKFIVAILVIANHTGPMHAYNANADYLISGILTRIAVPIFFMTSGFFFFRKWTGVHTNDSKAWLGYMKKIGVLYVIAILLYIPLNLYTGYFKESFTLYSFFKDIVFDGTFYHLWYLPALMIGITITYFLYRKMSLTALLAIVSLLYVIGLFGDSYYGLIEGVYGITQFYDAMFFIFDYTRNGLFYAPIYLVLGAWAAKHPLQARKPIIYASLFLLSLGLMFAEAIMLKSLELPRHDSMYIFALPATYFLFQWALLWKGQSGRAFREWRVWIYILHPIAIVLVRGAAKAAGIEAVFITNSLIHFAAVCLLSVVLAAVAVKISDIKFKIAHKHDNGRRSLS